MPLCQINWMLWGNLVKKKQSDQTEVYTMLASKYLRQMMHILPVRCCEVCAFSGEILFSIFEMFFSMENETNTHLYALKQINCWFYKLSAIDIRIFGIWFLFIRSFAQQCQGHWFQTFSLASGISIPPPILTNWYEREKKEEQTE